MPNSVTQRLENCYMPPKKFAWRFENQKHLPASDQDPLQDVENSSPDKEFHYKMKFLPENGTNTSPPLQQGSAMEPLSPAKHPETDQHDAPLDFSVKHDAAAVSSNGRMNSPSTPVVNGVDPHLMQMNYSEYLKRLQNRSSTAFPGMINGRSPPPVMTNGHSELQRHDAGHYNGNPSDMNNCEKPKEYLNGFGIIGKNGVIMTPGEKCPEPESPILQGMLTAPVQKVTTKIKEININTSESFHRENGIPMMSSPSQPFPPNLLSPVNSILPLSVAPFLGGMGYMGPTVGAFPGSLLAQSPDGSMLHALAAKRQRKKKPDERPFKSYTIDVLQEKLHCATGFGYDFNKHARAQDRNESGPSGHTVNNKNCTTVNGSSAPRPNINGSANESPKHGAINLNNGCLNGKDNQPNGADNQQNVSCDSNDSFPSPDGPEGPSGLNRKRKTTDAEKDDAYWDRRRKNNLAAKRSREARRRKEDTIANMAIMYEAQCLELKNHLTAINFSYNDLTAQFNRLRQEHEAMKIQNNVLQERLSQKRCGQCGAKLPSVN